MTARDDEENLLRDLMIRYQSGDADAVEQLVTVLSPRLHGFLRSPHNSREENEDLLQECWMRIHRSRQTYRASEPLLPWVFAIARHSRLDAYRRRRRRGRREVLVSEPPDVPRWDVGGARHDAGDLSTLVEKLPEEQRDVILMLKVSGMSVAEVARATQSTSGAVKQKAHRAYKKLREWLASDRSRRNEL
jgi:RNA polymerase sigma-70 factor (ECF subfamily)